jgi:Icc-related predicted phosphoesterase
VIRVAAVADIHVGSEPDTSFDTALCEVHEHADVLLLGGDLTRCGSISEAECLLRSLEAVSVPIVAVLGNHDHHAECEARITKMLESEGIRVLEGEGIDLDLPAGRLGVAGTKGFGGGFGRSALSAFGEREIKTFASHAHEYAERLEGALSSLESPTRVALLHYAPVEDTIVGEPLPIYPFLGSYLLGEVADRVGADLVLHGHAHAGRERGATAGGVPVRNVARPVIHRPYRVYELDSSVSSDFDPGNHRPLGGRLTWASR